MTLCGKCLSFRLGFWEMLTASHHSKSYKILSSSRPLRNRQGPPIPAQDWLRSPRVTRQPAPHFVSCPWTWAGEGRKTTLSAFVLRERRWSVAESETRIFQYFLNNARLQLIPRPWLRGEGRAKPADKGPPPPPSAERLSLSQCLLPGEAQSEVSSKT